MADRLDRSRERKVAQRDVAESLEALAEKQADDEELLLWETCLCPDWREHEIEAILARLVGEPMP